MLTFWVQVFLNIIEIFLESDFLDDFLNCVSIFHNQRENLFFKKITELKKEAHSKRCQFLCLFVGA